MSDGGEVAVVRARGLCKTFRAGLGRRPVVAVDDASFEVRRGEIFGLFGPNGAGKSSTLRMLVGLVLPSAGRAELWGGKVTDALARGRVGYLAERAAIHEHLTPEEALDLAGVLAGLPRAARRAEADALLARLGLDAARGRAARRLSRGTQQRLALAQALVGNPELLVLDEPMSALDPLGRREVRALLLALRAAGTTIVQSTHVLADVEATCDRVAIMVAGRVRRIGAPEALAPLEETLACEAAAAPPP